MTDEAQKQAPVILAGGRDVLPYRVGPLLYTPASRQFACRSLRDKFGRAFSSLAFCLEDSIRDQAVESAQRTLLGTLRAIEEQRLQAGGALLFVRVRSPEHLGAVHRLLASCETVLTGYILPKFDLSNAERYVREIESWDAANELRIMPILESAAVADVRERSAQLSGIRDVLAAVGPRVLNVRVGGNDLCNLFGVRRSVRQTIYDVAVVRDVLADIVNIFSRDYVVAAPVWEYFGSGLQEPWAQGLRAELELDRANGFVGKTAIHPAQLEVIRRGMQVSRADYQDAMRLLCWDDSRLGVGRSVDGGRMNEVRCHSAWAERTAILGQIYGIRENEQHV